MNSYQQQFLVSVFILLLAGIITTTSAFLVTGRAEKKPAEFELKEPGFAHHIRRFQHGVLSWSQHRDHPGAHLALGFSSTSIGFRNAMGVTIALLYNHPHLSWHKACEIERHEVMPLPGGN